MTIDVKEKLKTPRLAELLETQVPLPKGRWELVLKIDLEDGTVWAKTVLSSVAPTGLFSEEARMVLVQDERTSDALHTDVEGELMPETADFNVHIQDPDTELSPFACLGHAVKPEKAYEGEWSAPCCDPEGCGCEGMTGTFTLTAL